MKQLYILILVILAVTVSAQARPVIIATAWWGNWSDKTSWNLNRIPQDGDSIVIPAGKGIVFDKNDKLDNVFINVMGTLQMKKKMTLDEESVIVIAFGGTINAFGANRNNETIELGGKYKYDEKSAFSISGLAYATRNTLTSPNGFVFGALSVKYVSFNATKKGNHVELNWATAQETGNSHFNIERSFDGRNWSTVAVVKGNGTTNMVSNYSYSDRNVTQTVVYYRLRQVDLDGKTEYSAVKTIRSNETNAVANIFASSRQQITVDLNKEVKGQLTVHVMNMNGQVVAQQSFTNASYRINLSIANNSSGIYVVQVTDGKGWSESKKVAM